MYTNHLKQASKPYTLLNTLKLV